MDGINLSSGSFFGRSSFEKGPILFQQKQQIKSRLPETKALINKLGF